MKLLYLFLILFSLLRAQEIGVPFADYVNSDTKITALTATKDGQTIFAAGGGLHRIELSPIKVTFGVNVGIDSRETVTYINGEKIIGSISKGTTVNHIALSPDEHIVVTCGSDKILKAWDAKNGKLLQTFIGHNSPVKSAVILFDNKTLISGDENMTIKYWDISSGKEIKSFAVNARAGDFNNNPEILHNLYLSSNGKILIVYDSYRVGFIDVDTGKVMKEYRHKSDFYEKSAYFFNDILYVLLEGFGLKYDVGKFIQIKDTSNQAVVNHININDKNVKFDKYTALSKSCITDQNDILTILIHSKAEYINEMSSTTPPLVLGKVKVYGSNFGRIIIDQCPRDNNQITIEPLGNKWFAITSDGYFDTTDGGKRYIYIRDHLGKAMPIDDATYNKYHKPIYLNDMTKDK